jgi:hypothetical protein
MELENLMLHHHPQGSRLPALERNILKYRTFEMVMILFHVENLKAFLLNSLRVTDEFRDKDKRRIPDGTKKLYEKAWSALVNDGILTQTESDEVQRLVDYRNDIGHRIHLLTCDLSRSPAAESYLRWGGKAVKYDYDVLKRLKYFREKIMRGIQSKYITSASPDYMLFEAAEKTYQYELRRLVRKVTRQIAIRQDETQNLSSELSLNDAELLGELDPHHDINAPTEGLRTVSLLNHPSNKAANGTLTKHGADICYWLFDHNKSPLAVAYLMRISYRSALNRRRLWEKASGHSRQKSR